MLPDDAWLMNELWALDDQCDGNCGLPLFLRGYDQNVTVHTHKEFKLLRAITIECSCGASTYLPLGKYVDEAIFLGCPDVRELIGDPPDHLMQRAHEAGLRVSYIPRDECRCTPGDECYCGVISASTLDWWQMGYHGAPGITDSAA